MGETEALVQIRDLHKQFRRGSERIDVLQGVTIDLPRGDFLALMGPSGSGKTTLLNLVGGLDTPSAGSVTVGGDRIDRMSGGTLARWRARHIGFVFQLYNLLPVLTALENAEFPMLLQGVPADERRARVHEMFERTGMTGLEDRRPGKLSGGQQQRVAVVRAVASRPALVLADEPTANLDSAASAALLDVMADLNRELGVTFVFATHDARVMERSRRLVRMVDGRIDSDETRT